MQMRLRYNFNNTKRKMAHRSACKPGMIPAARRSHWRQITRNKSASRTNAQLETAAEVERTKETTRGMYSIVKLHVQLEQGLF